MIEQFASYFTKLEQLSSDELLRSAEKLVVSEHTTIAKLIAHLAEMSSRKTALKLGYSSLYDYCITRLNLSEGAVPARIHVANVSRRFPQLLAALAESRVSLTVAALMAPHLTQDNVKKLISDCAGMTRRQTEEYLVAIKPKPVFEPSIRKRPSAPAVVPEPSPRDTTVPSASLSPSSPLPQPPPAETPKSSPPCTLAEAYVQRKRMLREESIGNVDVQGLIPRLWREASIISRRRRETGRSSRVGEKRMSLLCDNSEPRPPQTTGALMFGWPPKEALQKLKLASHIRAAIVQCFAESQMATKPVVLLRFFCRNKNCGMPFFICKSCYCGQCYCGPTCREQTRRENQRENNRNYQKGFNARRLHAARQQKYRHAAKIVTEQGFILPSTYGNLGFREIQASGSMAHSMKTKIDSVRYAKCCICGRRGRWKNVEAE